MLDQVVPNLYGLGINNHPIPDPEAIDDTDLKEYLKCNKNILDADPINPDMGEGEHWCDMSFLDE